MSNDYRYKYIIYLYTIIYFVSAILININRIQDLKQSHISIGYRKTRVVCKSVLKYSEHH